MPIVLTRIDDRLIHGQVILGWTRNVGGTYIVVADDAASKDVLQKSLMKAATPVGVKSSVLSIQEAAEFLKGPKLEKEKTLIIVKDALAVLGLLDNGVAIEKINVGNIRFVDGRKKITNWMFVSDEEIVHFKELCARGVQVIAQWLPGDETADLNKVFENY